MTNNDRIALIVCFAWMWLAAMFQLFEARSIGKALMAGGAGGAAIMLWSGRKGK